MAAAAILDFGKLSITPDWINISASNLLGNALDIGLYNSLYYRTSCDHGVYGSTNCFHSLNGDQFQ